jgi:hypothetical protein
MTTTGVSSLTFTNKVGLYSYTAGESASSGSLIGQYVNQVSLDGSTAGKNNPYLRVSVYDKNNALVKFTNTAVTNPLKVMHGQTSPNVGTVTAPFTIKVEYLYLDYSVNAWDPASVATIPVSVGSDGKLQFTPNTYYPDSVLKSITTTVAVTSANAMTVVCTGAGQFKLASDADITNSAVTVLKPAVPTTSAGVPQGQFVAFINNTSKMSYSVSVKKSDGTALTMMQNSFDPYGLSFFTVAPYSIYTCYIPVAEPNPKFTITYLQSPAFVVTQFLQSVFYSDNPVIGEDNSIVGYMTYGNGALASQKSSNISTDKFPLATASPLFLFVFDSS